jgi:hypothetical protein
MIDHAENLRQYASREFNEGGCQWCAMMDAADRIDELEIMVRGLMAYASSDGSFVTYGKEPFVPVPNTPEGDG